MTSISDGSLPEEEAKAFAQQYAKELQEEKQATNDALVQARGIKEGDTALYVNGCRAHWFPFSASTATSHRD